MILLNNLNIIIPFAFFLFSVILFMKIYFKIRNIDNAFYAVFYFYISSLYFPASFAKDLYENKTEWINWYLEEEIISQNDKPKLESVFSSKFKLLYFSYRDYIINFPDHVTEYIDTFIEFHYAWFNNKNQRKKVAFRIEFKKSLSRNILLNIKEKYI